MCISYRSMFMYCRYLCGGTLVPWYIVISVTLISYWLLPQHVRANKASLQTLSVSSFTTPPTTTSRPATAYRDKDQSTILFFDAFFKIKFSFHWDLCMFYEWKPNRIIYWHSYIEYFWSNTSKIYFQPIVCSILNIVRWCMNENKNWIVRLLQTKQKKW